MARIRTVKPEFWTSEQVSDCSMQARLLFIGMWNFCDDAGRHRASHKRLKMEVLPGDAVSDTEVTQWVRELIDNGLLEEYEIDGDSFWEVTGWSHQKIDKPNYKHPSSSGEVAASVTHRLGGKQRQLALKKLIARDGEECANCGSKHNLAIDHIMPVSKGGSNDLDNLQILCKPCNGEKYDKTESPNFDGDAKGTREVHNGDAKGTRKVRDGDAPPEGSLREGSLRESKVKEDSCSEVAAPPSEPASDDGPGMDKQKPPQPSREKTPAEVPLVILPCVGNGQKTWAFLPSMLPDFQEAYPGIDVVIELKKAALWLKSNPKKRKTRKGLPAFLAYWMSRSQDRGGGARSNPSKETPKVREPV